MKCDFCYRMCDIPEGKKGYCNSRINDGGVVKDRCYGGLVSIASDPVEKKPLYHFLPGTQTLSIAMQGCNLTCDFCQNHEISQQYRPCDPTDPEYLAGYAASHGFPSISYTYSEPIVWQDYMLDTAISAHKNGLANIMVTNGSFSEPSLSRVLPHIDAYNIDLKGDGAFYENICHGSISPVLSSIRRIAGHGAHIEVTTMVIEGIHDEKMIASLGGFLHSAGVRVWHLTRFFPMYRMSGWKVTGEGFLKRMLKVAEETGVPFIYPGNSRVAASNRCPMCNNPISLPSTDGLCPWCNGKLYGVYSVPPLSEDL